MKKIMLVIMTATFFAVSVCAQTADEADRMEARAAAIREIKLEKAMFASSQKRSERADSSDLYDQESFGKNVQFLGAFYAGTVYIYHSCDPQVLLDELGMTLAPDDKCIEHSIAAPMGPIQTVSDPQWQITIPGKTVDNVIFPLLNNNFNFTVDSLNPGSVSMFYAPRVTIESVALSDPAAIDPATGLPMNGSYTVGLPGSFSKQFMVGAGEFMTENSAYASVSSRGLSRDYFTAIGLPQSVVTKLYKKPMTLRFSIRIRVGGPVSYGHAFYTYRLIGN